LKTFWGWRDKQLPDGTVVWVLPDGHTYVTHPGSALLFPNPCAPTGDLPPPPPRRDVRCGNRGFQMPSRVITRSQSRAHRVDAERRLNRRTREAAQAASSRRAPDDPPPF
jgi:hypothetical protein